MSKKVPFFSVISISLMCLIFTIIFALGSGSAELAMTSVLDSLFLCSFSLADQVCDVNEISYQIVWEIRLPRVLMAMITGAGLSVTGAILQSVTRNPLADPYLFGISSGASLGAVIVRS